MSKTHSRFGATIPNDYLVYTALISQAGVSAPTAIVLKNTLSAAIVWSYDSVGVYEGTLIGAFPANKVWFSMIGPEPNGDIILGISRVGNDSVKITVNAAATLTDGLLDATSLEIRVYP